MLIFDSNNKLDRVIEKYSENAKNNKAPIKNQGEGKE